MRDIGPIQKRPITTVRLCTVEYFRGLLTSVENTTEELEWWQALLDKLDN